MNKFWLIIVPVLALLITACGEDGSYWSGNTVQLESDAVGRLETQGNDLRIYEFTPQTDPSRQCVFVTGSQKAGLTCWKKGG